MPAFRRFLSTVLHCTSLQHTNIASSVSLVSDFDQAKLSEINACVLLRLFKLVVAAHPYCARKFTHYIMHESACLVITEQWKGRWPVLYLFLDLTILDIPIFPLMEHFLYQFSTLSENMTNLSTRNLNFLQNASLKSILFSSLFSVHNGFKCLLKG